MPSMYQQLGVDAMKGGVRKAFGSIIDNVFPGAFVNIVPVPGHPGEVATIHSDGDGSKMILRLLYALSTGDFTILRGAVDDAVSMNTGDAAAAGFIYNLTLNDVININGINLPKNEILLQMAEQFRQVRELYRLFGFEFCFVGGETADLPDQVSSQVFDVSIHSMARDIDIIRGNVCPGDCIIGIGSDGQACWELMPNSGVMSNGITLARFKLLHPDYVKQYPFLIRPNKLYEGQYLLEDTPACLKGMSIGEALMSPTRHWALVIKRIVERLKRDSLFHMLHGITMNTGGGAYKVSHLGTGIRYIKEMPPVPSVFQLIQSESGESWRNMFEAMNCGVGLDIIGEDDPLFRTTVSTVVRELNLSSYDLGFCEKARGDENEVVLSTLYGTFDN